MYHIKKHNNAYILFWKMDPAAERHCSAKLEATTMKQARLEARQFMGPNTHKARPCMPTAGV